jgi:hypothetical protein
MSNFHDGAAGADRRAQIEAALATYPDVSPERLSDLLDWFGREASALDVALVASNPAIAEPYARFRADHIDRLKARDIIRGLLFAAALVTVFAAIVWRVA